MRLEVFAYRAGTILALAAIYDAVGGPMVGQGGASMAVAMSLMTLGLFYRAITDEVAKRRENRTEVSA